MAGGSVTLLMRALRNGDQEAARRIWELYRGAMLRVAARLVPRDLRRAADEEDAVLCAFDSLFRRARNGQFEQFDGRRDLWRLLVAITRRKAINLVRHEQCQKRDRAMLAADRLEGPRSNASVPSILLLPDNRLQPALEVAMEETFASLLERLPDDEARTIVQSKLAGDTNEQIARELGCVRSTVDRRLRVIRRIWSDYLDETPL